MVRMTRLLEDFFLLTRVANPSRGEGRIGRLLAKKFSRLGGRVQIDSAHAHFQGNQGNLVIDFPASGVVERPIALAAHLDSLGQEAGRNGHPVVSGNYICSGGGAPLGADDRAGIAAILEGIRLFLARSPRHPGFQVILTVAEEDGLLGSRHLDYSLVRGSWVFVFDGTAEPGTLYNQGPGEKLFVRAVGTAGSEFVPKSDVRSEVAPVLSLITSPPSRSGGRGGRGVAVARPALRLLRGGKEAGPKESAPLRSSREVSPYLIPLADPLCRFGVEALESLAWCRPVFAPAAGICDCQIFNQKGLKAINLGLGIQQAHTPRERISVDHLARSAEMVHALLERHRHG